MTQKTTPVTPDLIDLIGVPYKDNGRDLSGLDCYGLAIEVERRFGKTLRDVVYNNHSEELAQKYAPTLNVKKRPSNDFFNIGDLVEIHINGTLHIGVIISNKQFIHATTNQGVRISMLKAYPILNIYEVL